MDRTTLSTALHDRPVESTQASGESTACLIPSNFDSSNTSWRLQKHRTSPVLPSVSSWLSHPLANKFATWKKRLGSQSLIEAGMEFEPHSPARWSSHTRRRR